MKFKKIIFNKKGITLLEVIVAVALFAVTIISITEIFVLVLDGQRNAIASRNIQENIRYAFEMMSKEMRMARLDSGTCDNTIDNLDVDDNKIYDDDGAGTYLKFKNNHNQCVKYSLETDANGIGRIRVDRDLNWGYLTPDDISISNLEFLVYDNYYQYQSLLTFKMIINTVGGKIKHQQEMKIQTSISSRFY